MGLDDFIADELFDLFLDLNVTEEWQLLSIREHWKQQYKNTCSLFATDKVELNKRLLRLNKAYHVLASIETDQRRQLYLRYRSLPLYDQIELLENNNDDDQSSAAPTFLDHSRTFEDFIDQKHRSYEILEDRRRRELEEAAECKADLEIDLVRRSSQDEVEQSNRNEQSTASSLADATDSTILNSGLQLLKFLLDSFRSFNAFTFFVLWVITLFIIQQQNPPQKQNSPQTQDPHQKQVLPEDDPSDPSGKIHCDNLEKYALLYDTTPTTYKCFSMLLRKEIYLRTYCEPGVGGRIYCRFMPYDDILE